LASCIALGSANYLPAQDDISNPASPVSPLNPANPANPTHPIHQVNNSGKDFSGMPSASEQFRYLKDNAVYIGIGVVALAGLGYLLSKRGTI
jgi:hypothetical protein